MEDAVAQPSEFADSVSAIPSSPQGPSVPASWQPPQPSGAPRASGCVGCGDNAAPIAADAWGYIIGRLEPRYPNLGVEHECEQLLASSEPEASEPEALNRMLSQPENRYLIRQLCWVLTVSGGDELSVSPTLDIAVDELVTASRRDAICVVIGAVRPGGCLGPGNLDVAPVQLLTFGRGEFVANMVRGISPGPTDKDTEDTEEQGKDDGRDSERLGMATRVVEDLFDRFVNRAGNRGVTPESRAINYLALRVPAVYALVLEQAQAGASVVGVDTEHRHSSGRTLVVVHVTFRARRTNVVSRYTIRVDVTDVFPFLVTSLQPSYDG